MFSAIMKQQFHPWLLIKQLIRTELAPIKKACQLRRQQQQQVNFMKALMKWP